MTQLGGRRRTMLPPLVYLLNGFAMRYGVRALISQRRRARERLRHL
jgi:hypothetical protein